MGVLDPVELHELAEHMRDGTWLDMRVIEHGTIERARVEAIIVRRDDEEIELLQEHMLDGVVHQANVRVSADAIRWMKPSGFDLVDVEVRRPKPPTEVDNTAVTNAIKDLIVFLYKDHAHWPIGSRAALEKAFATPGNGHTWTGVRHVFVWLMKNYTDGIDALDICKMAGYRSVMPLQSARWKYSGTGKDAEEAKRLDELMAARGFAPTQQ